MKYRWYYIEVFRDAKERFEKQKTAGAEIPQQSLLEGAFEYLDQRHSLGEEEQYDQGQYGYQGHGQNLIPVYGAACIQHHSYS